MKTRLGMLCLMALMATASLNATELYTKCVVCHGEKGEKVALNKSLIIKDMSKDSFIAAMKGYKDGSYGKTLKGLMKPQVATLNDAQMEEIANYIVTQ